MSEPTRLMFDEVAQVLGHANPAAKSTSYVREQMDRDADYILKEPAGCSIGCLGYQIWKLEICGKVALLATVAPHFAGHLAGIVVMDA